MKGLPLQLKLHLQSKACWVSKGTLTADKVWKHDTGKNAFKRYLPETVGRCLRSMEEDKILAVRDEGVSVEYRFIPFEHRHKYIPWSQRSDKKVLWLQK